VSKGAVVIFAGSKGGRVGYKVNKEGRKKRVFADGHEI
jgi:hypothetical protein